MNAIPEPAISRDLHTQQVSFIRRDFTHFGAEEPFLAGVLPSEAVILAVKVFVKSAFTGAKLKFGTTPEVNDLSEADVGQLGDKAAAIMAAKWNAPSDKDMPIYCKLDKKVNQGSGSIVVLFATNR